MFEDELDDNIFNVFYEANAKLLNSQPGSNFETLNSKFVEIPPLTFDWGANNELVMFDLCIRDSKNVETNDLRNEEEIDMSGSVQSFSQGLEEFILTTEKENGVGRTQFVNQIEVIELAHFLDYLEKDSGNPFRFMSLFCALFGISDLNFDRKTSVTFDQVKFLIHQRNQSHKCTTIDRQRALNKWLQKYIKSIQKRELGVTSLS